MDDPREALDYYRRQCDELGGRVLRLQEELTQTRREARRNRTLAQIVQQLHGFAHGAASPDASGETLEEALLMLMVERLRVDCAALLRWQAATAVFQVEHGLGVPTGLQLPAAPALAGGVTEISASALRAAGLAHGIWVIAPPSPWVLLLGHRDPRTTRYGSLDESDRPIAEAALKVYSGLVETLQAAQALQASETNYRTLFESAQDAIVVLDIRNLTLLDANQQALELFDCPLDELRRQPPNAWLIPADPVLWRPVWKASLAGRSRRIETRVRTAAGQFIWAEITLKRIDTGRHLLLAVVRDISTRKQSEEALKRIQERLDLALEGAEVGLYDANLQTGELVMDERYQRMLGIDPSLADVP